MHWAIKGLVGFVVWFFEHLGWGIVLIVVLAATVAWLGTVL